MVTEESIAHLCRRLRKSSAVDCRTDASQNAHTSAGEEVGGGGGWEGGSRKSKGMWDDWETARAQVVMRLFFF
jgi:hypothetical protein